MKKTYSGLNITVIRLQERSALLASSDNGSTPSDPSQATESRQYSTAPSNDAKLTRGCVKM